METIWVQITAIMTAYQPPPGLFWSGMQLTGMSWCQEGTRRLTPQIWTGKGPIVFFN